MCLLLTLICYIFVAIPGLCFGAVSLQSSSDTFTIGYLVKPLGWFALFLCLVSICLFACFASALGAKAKGDLAEFAQKEEDIKKVWIIDQALKREMYEEELREGNPSDYEIYKQQVATADKQGLIKPDYMPPEGWTSPNSVAKVGLLADPAPGAPPQAGGQL